MAKELVRYRLDLEGVQEVRWEKGGTAQAEEYAFKYRRKWKSINQGQNILYTTEYYQQLREDFVNDSKRQLRKISWYDKPCNPRGAADIALLFL